MEKIRNYNNLKNKFIEKLRMIDQEEGIKFKNIKELKEIINE